MTDPIHLLEKLAVKAGLPKNAWKESITSLRRKSWDHYVENHEDRSKILRLRRLRPPGPMEITMTCIVKRLRLAQDRLLAIQVPEGFYLYKYHPFTEVTSINHVNSVRQAGCAYAMAISAAREQDRERARQLKRSASRLIDFLLSFSGGLPIDEISFRALLSQHLRKLGTVALILLAMQHGNLPIKYEKERSYLTNAILRLQNKNGSFSCYVNSKSSAEDNKQNYFPGEALLALYYEAYRGRSDCKRAIEDAFEWYKNHFKQNPATAFVLWQTDVWSRMYEWNHQNSYADFVFEMVDWILQFQLDSSYSHEDFIGGFTCNGMAPGCSTATYNEAIIRAYNLAKNLQLQERTKRYYRAARLALRFIFRLQIMPETAHIFSNPIASVGGITQSLADFTLRCDYDQHFITMLLTVLETAGILDDFQPD